MKTNTHMRLQLLTMIGLLGAATLPAYGDAECDALGKEVKTQISSEPKTILVVVDAAIAKNASCACEIVSAAISLVPDDHEMIREIVATAVAAAPDEAPKIAECAIASAPEASTEIAAALDKVFEEAKAPAGGKEPVSGKNPISAKGGKEVMVDEDLEPTPPVSVSGVYLIAPGGSASVEVPEIEIIYRKTKRHKPHDKTTPPRQTPTDP